MLAGWYDLSWLTGDMKDSYIHYVLLLFHK